MEKFMKKIWKKNDGFTLVELIVVIAILGILAAVAVPAYSGYIEKANESSDTQLVSSINTAIQSAAAAQGKTAAEMTTPNNLDVDNGGAVTVTIGETAAQNDLALFLNADAYGSGVEVTGFKYYTKLVKGTDGLYTGQK